MPQHLLEGQVEDARDQTIRLLQDENDDLRRELRQARGEIDTAKSQAARSVINLRRQLKPLYVALQQVFGEIDAINPQDEGGGGSSPRVSAVWEDWKRKMPGMPATFIDVLMTHGSMNAAQLRIAAKCGNQTVYDTIHKLNKAGLIDKAGGRFSLKQL